MPCRDFYNLYPEERFGKELVDKNAEIDRLKQRLAFAESALCGVLTSLDRYVRVVCCSSSPIYEHVNYNEIGISKEELVKWHFVHQTQDLKFREIEAKQIEIERKKKEEVEKKKNRKAMLLARLSEEDKVLLGIKE